MARTGRPTDFTPEVRDKIIKTLSDGHFRKTAAKCAGVSVRSVEMWLAKGRKQKKGEYRDFFRSVQKAEHDAEIKCLKLILDHADVSTKQWFLERRFPERWSAKRFDLIKLEKQLREMDKTMQQITEKFNIQGN